MADELEERLREAVTMEYSSFIGERDKLFETNLGPEAADEITRLNAENERARNDALEEAAKVAEKLAQKRREQQAGCYGNRTKLDWAVGAEQAAAEIRALITKASRDSGHG